MSRIEAKHTNVQVGRAPVVPAAPTIQVKVELVSANDPTQQVALDGNVLRIRGTVSNNGIIRSHLLLKVAGKPVNVTLDGGEQPMATAQKVEAALPKGYGAVIEVAPSLAVAVTIAKKCAAR